MIKDIMGLRIQGANFETSKDLKFFANKGNTNKTLRVSLLYGKNGAGKTTISKAFRQISGIEENNIVVAEPIDENGNTVSLTEIEKKHILVFNEAFIDSQVRFQQDGLDTVVVFGPAVGIEEELNKSERRFITARENKSYRTEIVTQLEDDTNEKSPFYLEEKIDDCLKGKERWAERDMLLRENAKQATKVYKQAYEQYVNRAPSAKKDKLLLEFNSTYEKLKDARSGKSSITISVPQWASPVFDEVAFVKVLEEKLERPELSEREKYLLSLVEQKKEEKVREIKNFALNKKAEKCPFCFQDVSVEYKAELISSVEKILSRAVENHIEKLESFHQGQLCFDTSPFLELDQIALQKCEETINSYNAEVDYINKLIDQKKTNVFDPLTISVNLQAKFRAVNTALEELESMRKAYNANVTKTKPIIDELRRINADLAYYDTKEAYQKYLVQKKELEIAQAELRKSNQEYEAAKTEYETIQEKRKSVVIAKDLINRWLSYIFFSDKRLSLESDGYRYYIKTSGKAITPDKLSTGERNTLSLCYFFSTIMQGKEKDKIYNEPYFIVIDDPISSFDVENCIGVLSFLKFQLNPYLCGHADTKVLIMTHDLQTYFNLQKSSRDLSQAYSQGRKKDKFAHLELRNNDIIDFNFEARHEYATLILDVYNFAVNGGIEKTPTIGNTMRRVVEAFSSFIYKCGVAELCTKQEIINKLDVTIKPYFENLLYRLVLHGSSHMEERVKSLETMDLSEYLPEKTLQRTARDMICLLYCLNDLHVLTYLSTIADAEKTIKSWIEEIRKTNPTI